MKLDFCRHSVAAACLLVLSVVGADVQAQAPVTTPVDAAVKDLCGRKVVLLGEDANHGSGKTLEVKSALVRRLIDDCGFDAVFFESQIYDFLDLDQAFAERTARPEQLGDVIGGLWAKGEEIQTLIAFLFDAASQGRVRLAGLDPQVGGATQRYTQQRLAARLASVLDEASRQDCESAFSRHFNWRYDDASPFDAAAQDMLKRCAGNVATRAAALPAAEDNRVTAVMASNLVEYLGLSEESEPIAGFDRRDRAMHQNFAWHVARLPRDAKIIVWCASVHAAKTLQGVHDAWTPLGQWVHRAYGHRAAAVAFSAWSGHFGRPGKPPAALPTAEPDSLEAAAIGSSEADSVYLDHRALRALSSKPARMLDYRKSQSADWARLFDAVIVLREERASRAATAAGPRQPQP